MTLISLDCVRRQGERVKTWQDLVVKSDLISFTGIELIDGAAQPDHRLRIIKADLVIAIQKLYVKGILVSTIASPAVADRLI